MVNLTWHSGWFIKQIVFYILFHIIKKKHPFSNSIFNSCHVIENEVYKYFSVCLLNKNICVFIDTVAMTDIG